MSIELKNIVDYGLSKSTLEDLKNKAAENGKLETIVAALNNADTMYTLLPFIKEKKEELVKGMTLVKEELGANDMIIYLPEDVTDDVFTAFEGIDGVTVEKKLVNVRQHSADMVLHFMTYLDIAGALDGLYFALDGVNVKKYTGEEILRDLVENAGEVKGFFNGYEFFGTDCMDKKVGELPVESGIFMPVLNTDCVVKKTAEALTKDRMRSCGKCVFCREGLLQLEFMEKELTEGRGKASHEEIKKEISEAMLISTPCTMGQNASRIVISENALFAEEVEEHQKKKFCRAGVCFSKETYYVDPKLCTGCEECADVCPVDCIEGKANYIHMIDEFDCSRCGKCMEACEEDAIVKTSDKLPKLPDRLTKVGKFKK